MAFQGFSENFLDVLMVPLFQSFMPLFPVCTVICCLNLNEMLLFLLAGRSIMSSGLLLCPECQK